MSLSMELYWLVGLVVMVMAMAPPSVGQPWIVEGTGGSLPGPLYVKWTSAFLQDVPSIDVRYTIQSSGKGKEAVNSSKGSRYTFGATDSPLTNSELLTYTGVYQFPIVAEQLVFIYNLPDLTDKLVLSADLLAKIFLGNITLWNHPELVAMNPQLQSYNHEIHIPLRMANSGTTFIWTTYLSKASKNWTLGTIPTWPASILNRSLTVPIKGENSAVATTVSDNPYYCSYSPLAYALSLSVSFADIYDRYDRRVTAAGEKALDYRGEVTDNNFYELANTIIDRDDHLDPVWPIVGLTFILINGTIDTNCGLYSAALKYFYWCLTSELARSLARREGYLPVGPKFLNVIVPHLRSVQCDGKPLLVYTFKPKITDGGSITALAFSLLFSILLPILMIKTFSLFENTTSRIFVLLLFISSEINYLVPILWFIEPVSSSICMARLWITAIGISLLLVTVFNLTLQYYFVKLTYSSKSNLSAKIPYLELTIGCIVTFMLLQLIILIVWSAIDPYNNSRPMVLDPDAWIAVNACSSINLDIFLGIEAAFFLLLVGFGIFSVTYTWKLLTKTTRWVVMCIYNSLVAFVVVLVYFTLSTLRDEQLFLVIVLFLIFVTVGYDLAVLMTRLVDKERSKSKKESNNTTTGGPGGGGTVTQSNQPYASQQ